MLLKKGMKSDEVKALQGGLLMLGYHPGAADGDFGRSSEDALAAFQKAQKLYADGVAGKVTIRAYNAALTATGKDVSAFLIELDEEAPEATDQTAPPEAAPSKQKWVKCETDVVPGRDGYKVTVLREDTAADFKALCGAAHKLGGVVTSAGGRRALDSASGPNRSTMSLHYLGRAHDMSLDTGMQDPDTDPFIIERPDANSRYWRVWCKSTTDGSGPEVGEHTVDAWYMGTTTNAKGKTVKQPMTKSVTFTGFCFTDLAAKFGFVPIPCRPSFFSGDYLAAEWWHISYTKGLTPGITFGSELLKVYSPEDAKAFVYWDAVKDAKYGVNWS